MGGDTASLPLAGVFFFLGGGGGGGGRELAAPKHAANNQTKTASTFHHLSDLLPVHAVALLVDEGAQEVLEPVLDLRLGPQHCHPLSDRMPLHVLQVLDALHHLQAQSNIICKGCALVMGPSAVTLTY